MVAPINRVLNRFMAGDVELEQSDEKARRLRPATSHSRTQTHPHRESAYRKLTESAPLRARLTAGRTIETSGLREWPHPLQD